MSKEVKDKIKQYCLSGLTGLQNAELRGEGPGWFLVSVKDINGLPVYYKVQVKEQIG